MTMLARNTGTGLLCRGAGGLLCRSCDITIAHPCVNCSWSTPAILEGFYQLPGDVKVTHATDGVFTTSGKPYTEYLPSDFLFADDIYSPCQWNNTHYSSCELDAGPVVVTRDTPSGTLKYRMYNAVGTIRMYSSSVEMQYTMGAALEGYPPCNSSTPKVVIYYYRGTTPASAPYNCRRSRTIPSNIVANSVVGGGLLYTIYISGGDGFISSNTCDESPHWLNGTQYYVNDIVQDYVEYLTPHYCFRCIQDHVSEWTITKPGGTQWYNYWEILH